MKLDQDLSPESIDDLIVKERDSDFVIDTLEIPDYSYGYNNESLDYNRLRNKPSWWGWLVKTWYASIPGWYTDFAITWVWFTPKALHITVQTSGKAAWWFAHTDGTSITQWCTYSPGSWFSYSNIRLFRFDWTNVWLLVSFDADWFTVKSDLACTMIWSCFG
jgi:hypothetical protein